MLKRKSVYILSTGGTFSMQKTAHGYAPAPGYLKKAMEKIPELKNADMPNYTVEEYAHPIDSADMSCEHWMQIGDHIKKNYAQYDGFVILHGTDTMAYSASALSFILENLDKPVILTGAQLPLFETRSDARENLINALWMAGNYPIPEVCIYFNNKLFRGNRAKKIDANSFAAFDSPNFPALGKVGTEVRLRRELIRPTAHEHFTLQTIKPAVIAAIRVFPGVSFTLLEQLIHAPLQALILETYGVGTAPQDPRFINMLQKIVDRGVVVLNCSQCIYAKVKMTDYANSNALIQAGVLSARDMTVEAALAKLFYLFSKELSLETIKTQVVTNLRGELTVI